MNILFVCTGNTCRSPMAKILFEKAADERGFYAKAKSRGIQANSGDGISRGTYAVLLDEGIDSSFHKAQGLDRADLEEADRVFTMTRAQALALKSAYPEFQDKIQTLSDEDLADPFGGSLQAYKKTRDRLKIMLDELLDGLEGVDR